MKIFRKVRRKLAEDNKPIKYLRYAFGEIILVVLGILIALQINSWNEQRKLHSEEQYLLKELLAEFNMNLKKVQRDVFLNTKNQNAAIEILKMIQDQSLTNNEKKLDSLFVSVFSYGSFNAATGTLDEIISTGKLKVIRDNYLRNLLTQWPGWIENQQEDIDIRRNQVNDHVEPYFVKYAPFKNGDTYFDFSHWSTRYHRKVLEGSKFNYDYKALSSREFEGILYKYVLDQDFVLLNDVETEVFINKVIQQIKANIK
ncbi:MAG: DUF6090 family protein [Flavobacteriaceae bacterium]|nr:DUF6090 family protein [Flavobacteriaceae bacterium]